MMGIKKRKTAFTPLFAATMLATSGSVVLAGEPSSQKVKPQVEQKKYLVLDSRVIANVQNAKLTVSQVNKHPANPLFGEDKPWEKRYDNVYPNVIFDDEDQQYKCWYMPFITNHSAKGMTLQEKKTQSYTPPRDRDEGICYAYTKDGIKMSTTPGVSISGAPSIRSQI